MPAPPAKQHRQVPNEVRVALVAEYEKRGAAALARSEELLTYYAVAGPIFATLPAIAGTLPYSRDHERQWRRSKAGSGTRHLSAAATVLRG